MNVMVMGMTNWLSKPRGPTNKNLAGCLQRYVILGYERMRKYLILNTNNVILQIIPSQPHFDFHRRPGETYPTIPIFLDGRAVDILSQAKLVLGAVRCLADQ
jgi:hypothetical protein